MVHKGLGTVFRKQNKQMKSGDIEKSKDFTENIGGNAQIRHYKQ